MKKEFTAHDFDTVQFIVNGDESAELIEAKNYLKDIQMTINIGDVDDSLKAYINEKTLFDIYKESVFSNISLDFLERVKYMTSFEGIACSQIEKATFARTPKENYAFLQRNLLNHTKEFITAIWDCILLIKIAYSKKENSYLMDGFNQFFTELTTLKTGDASNYKVIEDPLDMITELVLFMQTYITDFLIFALKAEVSFATKKSVEQANRKFVKVLGKSHKIALRLQMFEQIKSKNYPLLLKLLLDQKHNELRAITQ